MPPLPPTLSSSNLLSTTITLSSIFLLLLSSSPVPAHGQNNLPDPIDNLIATYGEDLVPGYSQIDASAAAAPPVMSGIDMLRMAVPGTPGEDYPIYDGIPNTGFSCEGRIDGGYYADVEAQCQPFHICTADGSGKMSMHSFICPNGTLFNQEFFVCEYWFNVDCSKTESLYSLNEGIGDTAAGAASSPVGGYAPASPPVEDESAFLSSPVAQEPPAYDDDDGVALAPPSGDYGAPDSAASTPLSSYQPNIDSYGAPSADAAPVSRYTPAAKPSPRPQYTQSPPLRTGRKQGNKKKPISRRPSPPTFKKPVKPPKRQPRPSKKIPSNKNKPRGGRTGFNSGKRPSSRLPVKPNVFRQPLVPSFGLTVPVLTPVRTNKVNKPRKEQRGGRNQNLDNPAPLPDPAPQPIPKYEQIVDPIPPPPESFDQTAPVYNEPSASPVFQTTYAPEPAPTYQPTFTPESNFVPTYEPTFAPNPSPTYQPTPVSEPAPAPQKDYSFALSSPQGVEPEEYEYEEEPLPTYKGLGNGESSYVAPIRESIPAESPTYESISNSVDIVYDDEDPLPTYNRDSTASGGSYSAPGSQSLYGAPPPEALADDVAPVETGYGTLPPLLPPAAVSNLSPPVETGYGALSPIAEADPVYDEDDPLPTYNNPGTTQQPRVIPQTGYGAPPPLQSEAAPNIPPSVVEDLPDEEDPLPTYNRAASPAGSVDSYTAPGAIDSYGAPAPISNNYDALSANAITSYGAPPPEDEEPLPTYKGLQPSTGQDTYIADPETLDSYISPAAQPITNYNPPAASPTVDSYDSPAAPTLDSYESPAAPALDSYDSPAAPALDSYNSPAAQPLDSYTSGEDSYGAPLAPAYSATGSSSQNRPEERLPEYYKSEASLGLANPNEVPRIEPYLADYGASKPPPRVPRPPPPPPPRSAPPRSPRRKPVPPPDTGYGVPAAPPLGLPSYKKPRSDRGGFKRSLFQRYGR